MVEGILYQPDQTQLIVQIHPGQQGLEIDLPEGPAIWPYERLVLSWDQKSQVLLGLAGHRISVSHPDLLNILQSKLPPTQQQALHKILDMRRSRRAGTALKWVIASVLAMLLLVAGGYWLCVRGRDLVLGQIPVSWEATLGQQVYNQTLTTNPVCNNPLLTSGIARLQQQLQTGLHNSPYQLQFKVVQSSQINAFALPGGYIALNSALVAQAPSAEAVLGVMAHESEHVLQRHGLKGMINQLGIALALPLLVGDAHTVMGLLTSASLGLVNLGFDRNQESEADSLGLQLLQQAHINPQGMQSFFAWMASQDAKQKRIPEFLSTHPLSSERLKAISQTLAALPPQKYPPIELNWPKIQAAAKACTRQAP